MHRKMSPPQDEKAQESRYLVLDRNQPIPSERLFSLTEEVRIAHQGEEYRLRRTRAGKLILTK